MVMKDLNHYNTVQVYTQYRTGYYLHNQCAVLVTVFIEGVQLGDGVIKCLSQNKLDNIIIPRVNAHQITRQLDWLEKSMKIQRRFEGSWKITQSKILLWNFN